MCFIQIVLITTEMEQVLWHCAEYMLPAFHLSQMSELSYRNDIKPIFSLIGMITDQVGTISITNKMNFSACFSFRLTVANVIVRLERTE